ncbi:L,D-transpeptidase [Bradyrhizobium sp. ISRA443]|uniref:L,D-transpeptidase n=1 Tax=unclassified Bradyrhizobium TaxID=2631580 RepID=UPI00247A6471|nr:MULTISPECIES: L,D-transpeptidase [unclassified Bradyrhizobium]WGR98518.1 L,D-transpeptidase [Bradyrhizobium sp. ISRA436]WGS05407.1 L,D-transpeptidase [Bradyrhizobium sp. ISRA437]WGS12293.1 L,D-transpeptidase [Bradyrhizobium sp. ISRA443]
MNRRTFCITLIAASIGSRASAQNCDRDLWCEGSVRSQLGPMSRERANEPTQTGLQTDINLAQYAAIYGRIESEPFPVPAVKLSDIDPRYLRQLVNYSTDAIPGTIVVDPHRHFLYLMREDGTALRYGVGVGRAGFAWSGVAAVHDKREWPDWYPPKEMLWRQPELMERVSELQGGLGMPGGPRNPLGARAMYLWQGNKDTLYRIHGTNEPWTIGRSVSSGCIRMINQDAIDLYQRTSIGAEVVVLA